MLTARQISTSRLVTSYPIPPQESFTCPPYSIRVRRADGKSIERFTYIATRDSAASKLTLFKDVVQADGKTTSTTKAETLTASPPKYITSSGIAAESSDISDLIIVCENGEILSMDGETLSRQWSSSSQSAVQEAVPDAIRSFKVEYATAGTRNHFAEGIFKERQEVFNALPKALDSELELLALVVRSGTQQQQMRHLVIMAVTPSSSTADSNVQKVIPLDIAPLFPNVEPDTDVSCELDARTATLLQLGAGTLSVYDLTTAVPKIKTTLDVEDALSAKRLSKSFVLCSSLKSTTLYNYQYRSTHAKAELDISELLSDNQTPQSFELISYNQSQDLIIALVDNMLVSIHVEPPKHHGKRRKEGLLIDAIGRGAPGELVAKRTKYEGPATFAEQVPGTMTESYLHDLNVDIEAAENMVESGNFAKWEELLQKKFRVESSVNGQLNGDSSTTKQLPEWTWRTDSSKYPAVDRRWVSYALSRVFAIQAADSDTGRTKLQMVLSETNVATYLIVAGHVTLSNLKSVFTEESHLLGDSHLASDLIQSINEADPSLSLLLNYVQATKLGELELLAAIRALMLSMDFIPDTRKLNTTKLLKDTPDIPADDYEMDLDELERELEATEHYLGEGSKSRSRALTLAFTKLWQLPAPNTVKALRTTLRTEEILCFIYLLRMELVRGGWTTLYLDAASFDSEGYDPPPDGVISLIADLLGRCLDAIGTGGWLFNDAMSWSDKTEAGDFLTALKLEVSAALEGIEQAATWSTVVYEAERLVSASRGRQPADGLESRVLPIQRKSTYMAGQKIISGSEVVQKSVREVGHLISQTVQPYSLEKLPV